MSSRTSPATWAEKCGRRVRRWRARQLRFRVLRTVPENASIKLATKADLLRWRLLLRLPVVGRRFRAVHRARFAEDLRLLNDVLATTPLRDRYHVSGGLLLGWAREGQILAHDVGDADFFYPASAQAEFEDAQKALIDAGFRRWFCYRRSDDGRVAESVFLRRGSKFEFFALYDAPGDNVEYHAFGSEGTEPTEYISRIPQHRLAAFTFLDREWHKPADHDGFLTEVYGDWRVPRPDWWFADDELALVRTTRWGA